MIHGQYKGGILYWGVRLIAVGHWGSALPVPAGEGQILGRFHLWGDHI
jgi:hypothetical protein